MFSQAFSIGPSAFLLLLVSSALMAADEDRVLFDFEKPDAGKRRQTVNDGVMGGISDGRCKINDDKKMEFYGTLSLETP